MILFIDTTSSDNKIIALKSGRKYLFKEKTIGKPKNQSESLLNEIKNLFKAHKIEIEKIEKIKVYNRDGSFTSLRLGVAVANALGYALGVPTEGIENGYKKSNITCYKKFNIVKPFYNRKPNITLKK